MENVSEGASNPGVFDGGAPASADQSLRVGLADLVQLARAAFEEKRRKECLALTNAILKIDAENKDARLIQSLIQTDISLAVQRVRKLVEDPRSRMDEAQRQNAVRVLQNVLDINPDNKAAEGLLFKIDSPPPIPLPPAEPDVSLALGPETAADPLPLPVQPGVKRAAKRPGRYLLITIPALLLIPVALYYRLLPLAWIGGSETPDRAWSVPGLAGVPDSQLGSLQINVDEGIQVLLNDQAAGVAPLADLKSKPGTYHVKYKFNDAVLAEEDITVVAGKTVNNSIHALLGRLQFLVVPKSDATMQIARNAATAVPAFVDVKPGDYPITFAAPGFQPQTVAVSVAAGGKRNVSVILRPADLSALPYSPGPAPGAPQTGAAAAGNALNPGSDAKGTLAASSRLPVDIYLNDKNLGTTPVTLELAPGPYRLEYRYGNLRNTGVVTIRNKEVTRTMIAFEVTVGVDATPAADVFLEDVQTRALGHTPLNGIRAAIGSVLVFRAPGFPEKRHTVTENDTLIRMLFP